MEGVLFPSSIIHPVQRVNVSNQAHIHMLAENHWQPNMWKFNFLLSRLRAHLNPQSKIPLAIMSTMIINSLENIILREEKSTLTKSQETTGCCLLHRQSSDSYNINIDWMITWIYKIYILNEKTELSCTSMWILSKVSPESIKNLPVTWDNAKMFGYKDLMVLLLLWNICSEMNRQSVTVTLAWLLAAWVKCDCVMPQTHCTQWFLSLLHCDNRGLINLVT